MVTRAIQFTIIVLGIVGLYYLYKYLFAASSVEIANLLSGSQPANVDPTAPIMIPAASLVPLYEGGEFTLSMWVYVNNWSYRQGMNKYILGIGGNTFDTIRVYLGANKTQLHVRLQTAEIGAVPGGNSSPNTASIPITAQSVSSTTNLAVSNLPQQFGTLQTDSGLLDSTEICDLPSIDLQRWVNITIAVNGRTTDVYMDGKLARSCVLPSFYKVDSAYKATLLNYGGFGGNLATVNMYGTALNPSDIYKIYATGPVSATLMSSISSML